MAIEYHNPTSSPFGIDIIVITKNECPQCRTLKNRLDKEGIPYRSINAQIGDAVDAEIDPTIYEELGGKTAYQFVVDQGFRQFPFTVISDPEELYEDAFPGLRPDKISPLVRKFKKRREERTAPVDD